MLDRYGVGHFKSKSSPLTGILAVSDPIKESTPEALEQLRASGLHVVMLTGDNEKTAWAVAKQFGIDEVVADALPEEKVRTVERFQAERSFRGHTLSFKRSFS